MHEPKVKTTQMMDTKCDIPRERTTMTTTTTNTTTTTTITTTLLPHPQAAACVDTEKP